MERDKQEMEMGNVESHSFLMASSRVTVSLNLFSVTGNSARHLVHYYSQDAFDSYSCSVFRKSEFDKFERYREGLLVMVPSEL